VEWLDGDRKAEASEPTPVGDSDAMLRMEPAQLLTPAAAG